MVVSKDSKRKRKESPPPQTQSQQQQQQQTQSVIAVAAAATAVESSPEIPKRTKVQAQRKFAQGQCAPTSTYNSVVAASSTSNAVPGSSTTESREPPTEILPNRRPKAEDFLTFLCFRGTSALPANCDFFNEGSNSSQTKTAEKMKGAAKAATKKGKKGRPKASTTKQNTTTTATSAATVTTITTKASTSVSTNEPIAENAMKRKNIANDNEESQDDEALIVYAARKRAETLAADNNRRGRASTITPADEMNSHTSDGKRRSNRKDAKTVNVNEAVMANNTDKKLENRNTKNEDIELDIVKTRKGRPTNGNKRAENVTADNVKNCSSPISAVATKEKVAVKRSRVKESPIFIPSPEPSGRMTRQRAFFEPVKVPHRDDEPAAKNVHISAESSKEDTHLADIKPEPQKKTAYDDAIQDNQGQYENKTTVDDKNKSLNVFDFSSDDEQPLAKSLKVKKDKASPKKATNQRHMANKISSKQIPKTISKVKDAVDSKTDALPNAENMKTVAQVVAAAAAVIETTADVKTAEKTTDHTNANNANNTHTISKRGRAAKKKLSPDSSKINNDPDAKPTSPKKNRNLRQARTKGNVDVQPELKLKADAMQDAVPTTTRAQRPTRKTKEAAAIYMGIIGHKLQLADDEDDDLSLNSFPELPNVKEMEKMEFEIKKNASQITSTTTVAATAITATATTAVRPAFKELPSVTAAEKPATVRRGRPPKQAKQSPLKRDVDAANAKTESAAMLNDRAIKEKTENSKADSEDEDFLLNKEVNETKRKLEKSFSDSDDEPLAIKVHVKSAERDLDKTSKTITDNAMQSVTTTNSTTAAIGTTALTAAPGGKISTTPPLATTSAHASPVNVAMQTTNSQAQSPFKTIEKKSPVPTSKILNVPATYGVPTVNTMPLNVVVPSPPIFTKTTTYMPQASPHFHPAHVRPVVHQFQSTKSPSTGPTPAMMPTHLAAQMPPQSPARYQTPPAYPPPIDAYPQPKINPNFLTPKFDRGAAIPRPNSFPSPSPVNAAMGSVPKPGPSGSMQSPKTSAAGPSTSTGIAHASTSTANDPLKDEIGSILAANLMPSKEESGKIFGIASVSLAQSSGPDNTKCTLGKCGSIHKPVLGPVVPTEGYIGDQLSSKERRKAKVNMTHEQIQKWLLECSSEPDEIQDDLDDDLDDIRSSQLVITPPPTREERDAAAAAATNSSRAARENARCESVWPSKVPSLKLIPIAPANARRDEESNAQNETVTIENDNSNTGQVMNLAQKTTTTGMQNSNASDVRSKDFKEKIDKKLKEDKQNSKELTKRDISSSKQSKIVRDKELPTTSANAAAAAAAAAASSFSATIHKQATTNAGKSAVAASAAIPDRSSASPKQRGKKTGSSVATIEETSTSSPVTKTTSTSTGNTSSSPMKTTKRTPVYSQRNQKPVVLKESTTTSHRKTAPFSYGAFSADNERSVYSFDKDDDEEDTSKTMSKPSFQRQSRRDSPTDEATNTTTLSRSTPSKRRAAAAAAEKANKEIANANANANANASQNNSVSLTLSPTEKSKLVKVCLDAENNAKQTKTGKAAKDKKKSEAGEVNNETTADSDSEAHTFYIPLQGNCGIGYESEGGIQGVAVKLGREGPDGPNQKVIMHATLVTNAQMGTNPNPLPDSMNVTDIVKSLINSGSQGGATLTTTTTIDASKKDIIAGTTTAVASTSAAAAVTSVSNATNSASNSLKNVPIGTVQPRFKASDATPSAVSSTSVTTAAATGTTATTTTTTASASASSAQPAATGTTSGLVRVNSNSSLFSGSAKSRANAPGAGTTAGSKKFKDDTPIKMSNNTAFPRHDDPTQMVEAPIFRPTEKEFADPIEFIERITPIAARFGICKIIPPSTFKPECRISDEMRFTAYNQYVHKMLHRWGPSAKELSAIKKYLATQSIVMNHPPWIGGMEVDLPRLYHTVQELGGLKEVIEKKKWARVAEEMCIPKLAQDRVTKLDDIYCKYLLPYDTLSQTERQKLFDEVEADWAKREARARRNADRFVNTESVSNEEDDMSSEDEEESEDEVDGVSMECIVKGRSMPLSQFYRIARNTMALWFKNTEPIVTEVEAEFWRHVAVRDSHVCVHSGSIDSSGWGYGFPSPGPKGKGSNYARHPWNLKVLTNNPGSVLRSLGPVMGVTVPTLHVGMLFSAGCWYRDPHGLSWIEYLHTGASKLWYGIPDDQSANFRSALTSLIPTHCQNKTIWLPCDTVMVPPHMLTDRGVSLCRIEQKPGEFIVVFPRAYTSSLATGYVVSESVYFATSSWLELAKEDFRDIHDSCEPAMFSLEQLLFALGYDQRVASETLQQMLPMLQEVYEKETAAREQLKAAGVISNEKVSAEKGAKAKKQQQPPFKSIESECDLCRANLYISMVKTDENNVYCLQHALKNLNNGNIQAKQCKLIYAYNAEDILVLMKMLQDKIQQKRTAASTKKSK